MPIEIIILTGSELRHTFFRKSVANADGIEVLRSYCEGNEGTISEIYSKNNDPQANLERVHLAAHGQPIEGDPTS